MGSEGDSTRKNNVDENLGDSEQPLKKARYVWQVKGKYHLKDTEMDANESKTVLTNEDQNCNGRCYIESLLTHCDNVIGYEDSSEDECQKNIDKSIHDEIPVTLVKPIPKNQDYYLHKWQARQVAKGYMDNTINRVLETCRIAPFDASELIENCEQDGQVEDEGILMAIQSHGLHSNDDNWNHLNTKPETNSSFIKSQDIEQFALDNYQNQFLWPYKKKGFPLRIVSNYLSMTMEKTGMHL